MNEKTQRTAFWEAFDELAYLSNGPDKKESNNGIEHVGMQKGANFTIVCTILLIGLNSKS